MIYLLLELQVNLIFIGKKHFHENPLCFRIYADFEVNNKIDNCNIGNKTTNIYKLNPVLNGYHIESELEDFLISDFHKSLLGYDDVDCLVDEVSNLEKKKMNFYFKNSKKDFTMTQED